MEKNLEYYQNQSKKNKREDDIMLAIGFGFVMTLLWVYYALVIFVFSNIDKL